MYTTPNIVLLPYRAITVGIIGGKTWSYIPMGYGAPMINLGVTLYMVGKDYGTDPRAIIGWENDTKMFFFYGILPTIAVSVSSL
jgi:hypothetical protein